MNKEEMKRIINEMKYNISLIKEKDQEIIERLQTLEGEIEIYRNILNCNNKMVKETYTQIRKLRGLLND